MIRIQEGSKYYSENRSDQKIVKKYCPYSDIFRTIISVNHNYSYEVTMKILSLLIIVCLFVSYPVKSQWMEQTSPTSNPLYSVSIADNSTAWICGRYGTILKTTNGGAEWTLEGSEYFQNYIHFFAVFAMDDQTAFVAYKNLSPTGDVTNLFKTSDGGQTWAVVFYQTGGDIMDVRMFTPDDGFLYSSPLNTYWRFFNTTDGGNTWPLISTYPEQGPVEWGHHNATFIYGSEIFFGSTTGNIYHSTDTGYSWSLIPAAQSDIYAIWFNSPDMGLAGENSIMEKTTDGGSSWSPVTSLVGLDSVSAITGAGNRWWVANQNSVYYSDDNTESWSTEYTAPSGKFNHMSKARNGNLIIAVRNNGGISAYMAPVPVELISFTAEVADNNVLLSWKTASEMNNRGFVVQRSEVGSQKSVRRSVWEEIGFVEGRGTTPEESYYAFSNDNVDPGYYSYRLVQLDFDGSRRNIGTADAAVVSALKEYSLRQNYPNPFNPSTTIEYTIPEEEFVSIKIFNSAGEEINHLVNERKAAGSYSVNFNAPGLPSGIYYYRVESGRFSAVRKMILVK